MSFLSAITHRKKSPEQLVVSAKQSLIAFFAGDTTAEENLGKRLAQIKLILYGDGDHPEVDEGKALEVGKTVQSEGLIALIVENIENMPFEARKDAALIFNNLMRKNIANFADYVLDGFAVLVSKIINGYEHPDCALNCGSMLRECVRHDALAEAILQSQYLWKIFDSYVHLPNFEVASDAFNSLRDLLVTTKNKRIAATFLDTQFDTVFLHYEQLLQQGNYVTRRRALKLLGELLLDRSNFRVMMRYIASRDHLKTIMNFLRDPSPNIQFEAFHVFKVFVANPKKTPEITNILYKNKGKLIPFLEAFQTDKGEEQFNDEKRLLIETLASMEKPISASSSSSATEGTIATSSPASGQTSTSATDAASKQLGDESIFRASSGQGIPDTAAVAHSSGGTGSSSSSTTTSSSSTTIAAVAGVASNSNSNSKAES